MLLDNLFTLLGGSGTAMILLGIVAFLGVAPATWVLCPGASLPRLPRGR